MEFARMSLPGEFEAIAALMERILGQITSP